MTIKAARKSVVRTNIDNHTSLFSLMKLDGREGQVEELLAFVGVKLEGIKGTDHSGNRRERKTHL